MASSRRTLICAAALALASVAIASPAWAVPINFTGTSQDFSLTLSASGNGAFKGFFTQQQPYGVELIGTKYAVGKVELDTDGFTLVNTGNPFSTPLSLQKNVSVTSDPRSIGLPKVDGKFPTPGIGDMGFGAQNINGVLTRTLVSATNLDLDMLNGKTVSFALSDIVIPRTKMVANALYDGNPINGPSYYPQPSADLTLKISGTVKEVYLEQDMSQLPTFTPDGAATGGIVGTATGTFKIPMILRGLLDANIKVGGFDVQNLTDQNLSSKFNVTGQYELSGPASNLKIKLLGSDNVPFPLNFNTALTLTGAGVYGITTTVDLAASINLAYNFALNTITPIPEPGSIVLLAIGLMSVSPLIIRRMRQFFRRC
ncbi:MAG: hypothetical protein K2Y37_22790 [Pirellulales bacterium]|nr:hypothetical protein [Pirellulales bacterium]